ncbi:MAG: DUF1152 domain-containing protein, partial [Solirubrobacteraceae bacterium]|nr:DUF1152 domain-containing protein [Solirubrobacteraceae bacterium]
MTAADEALRGARRVLCLGIGGGGDVVGALAAAAHAEQLGVPAEVGGLTWERRPVDPLPGPRAIAELEDAEMLHPFAALAGAGTRGPGGFHFAESRMAGVLGRPVVLIDPGGGPGGVAGGIAAAATRLGCDLVVLLDVGGDVLAHGDEPGLASPLADAVLLAAAPQLEADGLDTLGVVFGAGCDGELTPAEVLERLAEVRAAGGDLGTSACSPATLEQLEAALPHVPTEASAMAVRCARGDRGRAEIRGGRRTVELTADGGHLHWFAPTAALRSAARLAAAVRGTRDLEDAHAILSARGVRTELAFER